jgi:hypothetical protein
MALPSDEITATNNDEVNASSSDLKPLMEQDEIEDIDTLVSEMNLENRPSTEQSISISSEEMNEENLKNKRQDRLKTRSVSFAPTVEEFEIPSRYDSSYISSRPSLDYIDALVESYTLQSLCHLYPLTEEKKYVPKTTRTRLNPNWREHRIRHLMNKLEELSLWDREEELKVAQAQFLREQKLEQIQDRQRNHDLCLNLMRQRHESEMESAVLLDRAVSCINDENTSATIAQAMNSASPMNILAYDLPTPPYSLKRRVQQEQEKIPIYKTPIGRYRQFERNMNNKLEKINEKLQPDWKIMRAYHTSIPPTFVPLFSETYTKLLSIPETYSSNRYNQYHYGKGSCLHQSSPHASSPDYETRLRSHSNRDVRVPFKDEATDDHTSYHDNDNDDDDDCNHSRLGSRSSKRQTNLTSNTTLSLYDHSPSINSTREYSFIRSPQPISNSIHQRSLNDDLNAITQYPVETGRTILRNITNSSNVMSTKNRSSSVPSNKRVMFIEHNDDDEENFNYNKSSRMLYQPESLSLSSNR